VGCSTSPHEWCGRPARAWIRTRPAFPAAAVRSISKDIARSAVCWVSIGQGSSGPAGHRTVSPWLALRLPQHTLYCLGG
jgi:hypothetical protein